MSIDTRVLKGFRDMLPAQEMLRRQILRSIEDSCRQFGFVPIDTPVLEYSEALLGKGGGETDKQVYRFEDHGGRDVAMRFDLTLPFARFMGAHVHELYLPFRRYHFAKVFRGENTQRGRYREFMQCDFDIVGVDSAAADFEILQLMYESFAAMNISGVSFNMSHRGMFNHFLRYADIEESNAVLRIVDKLGKIGQDETHRLLCEIAGDRAATRILDYIRPEDSNSSTLAKMEEFSGGESDDSCRLRSILALSADLGLSDHIHLNPAITRGLDYYTGIVYETFLDELPEIGSLCSGGRYNTLASLYSKTELPGVGSSIGLDRLIAALAELSTKETAVSALTTLASDVLIFMLDEKYLGHYSRIARSFRRAGFSTEIYPTPRKLAQQFSYAAKKNISLGIIAGENEIERGLLNYKDLHSKKSHEGISLEAALELATSARDN